MVVTEVCNLFDTGSSDVALVVLFCIGGLGGGCNYEG